MALQTHRAIVLSCGLVLRLEGRRQGLLLELMACTSTDAATPRFNPIGQTHGTYNSSTLTLTFRQRSVVTRALMTGQVITPAVSTHHTSLCLSAVPPQVRR